MTEMKKIGRKKPYIEIGIQRVPCQRCGKRPSLHQFTICTLDQRSVPICKVCDVVLNALVLKFLKVPNWKEIMKRYLS